MIEFPIEVKNNKNYRSYEVYSNSSELLAKWERIKDPRDIASDLINNILPVYYGEWQEWTSEQIKTFNDEHKLLKHSFKDTDVGMITTDDNVKMSAKEAARIYKENELAEAEALLASLKKSYEEV